MHYQGAIIRPPSEADAIILQVTTGCSHNRCTFCGAYRDRRFSIKPQATVRRDLDFAARHCSHLKTVFLADGNVLTLPFSRLMALCSDIRDRLPQVRRISLYGNARDVLRLSLAQLRELKAAGLGRVYMGLESGHAGVLARIRKGATPGEMIRAGNRLRRAAIFLSVTCLLGIAGVEESPAHARATAAVLNDMHPNQIAVLTLMLLDNTELGRQARAGTFTMPDRHGLLEELHHLLDGLELDRVQFQANHASSYLPLAGRLQRDREKLMALVRDGQAGRISLRAEAMRGL